jgi:polysaccharide pyruvyl transferase WcaK-like protein
MDITRQSITKLHEILSRFKKNGRLRVLLLGAYGHGNVGDLAILDAMIEDLNNDKEIIYTVASKDLFLKEHYNINFVNPFSIKGLLHCLKQDALVVGGGGLYGHETHLYMKIMMPFLIVAKMLLNRKLVFYNLGVYRAEKKTILKVLWFIIRRADGILFRDDTDIDIVPSDILQRAKIEPDITFSLRPKEPKDKDIVDLLKSSDNVVGLSLRFVNYKDTYNEYDECIAVTVKQVLIDEFLEKEMHILFMPFQPLDLVYIEHYFGDVIEKYKDKFLILRTEKYTINEIKWIISRLQLALGMRLHFQIFSHDLGVPIIGISYAPKNTNFLAKVEAPMVDAYTITADHLKNTIVEARINMKK